MSRPMDINQIIINMKTTDLFHPILLFALFLCGLAACNNDETMTFASHPCRKLL